MRNDLLRGNATYADTFTDTGLGAEPAKRLAVVTCMDTRLDVYALLGLRLGDAHVIRNAGGRVSDDVLRSLIVSIDILGTRSVAVIQHTECGMTQVTNAQLREIVHERRGVEPSDIDFLTIDDHERTLRNDVSFLEKCPFLPDDLEVFGFLYDIRTGQLSPV